MASIEICFRDVEWKNNKLTVTFSLHKHANGMSILMREDGKDWEPLEISFKDAESLRDYLTIFLKGAADGQTS